LRRIAAVAGAVLLALGACGGDDGYPPAVVDNFMESCTAQVGASQSYCRCAIERLQESMSFEDFQAAEAKITDGSENLPQELQDAVDSCVDEL
jgi:hypothetical protein